MRMSISSKTARHEEHSSCTEEHQSVWSNLIMLLILLRLPMNACYLADNTPMAMRCRLKEADLGLWQDKPCEEGQPDQAVSWNPA